MFYGEISEGDVLEWQTFGGQSTKILIVKPGEIVTYGNAKGKDKKVRPAFYIRSFYAFDDEPELVDAMILKQNCKRVEAVEADGINSALETENVIEDSQAQPERESEREPTYDEYSQAEPEERRSYSQDESEIPEQPKKPLSVKTGRKI